MRLLLVIFAFVLMQSALNAQRFVNPTWLNLGPKKASVGAYGYGSISSAEVTNSFLLNITKPEQLDAQVKSDQLANFKTSNNLVGGNYSLGLQGGFHLPNLCAGLVFNFSDEAHLSASFPGDLGKFVFDGNKQFAGREADFSRTSFNVLRYQKMGAGLNFEPAEDIKYGFIVSFLNGESTASLNLNNGGVYTSLIGDSVSYNLRGTAFYSDTSNTGFFKDNGGGVAVDLFFSQRLDVFNERLQVSALLMNVGMIQWHPETEAYLVDTTVSTRGIELNDLETAQSTINAYDLEDSLLGAITSGFSRATMNQVIPGFMQFEISRVIDKGFDAGAGVTIRWQTISRSYSWLNLGYRFSPGFMIKSELGYGGYGRFQAGLGASYRNECFAATLRIANIEAVIAPKTFGGITLGCGIQYFFGT